MFRGYKKVQIVLVKGCNRFVGGLYRLDSRRLYRSSSEYVELGACRLYVRSHGRIWNDTSYAKMSHFVVFAALVLAFFSAGRPFDVSVEAFTPPAPQFLNKSLCRIADMFRDDVPWLDIWPYCSPRQTEFYRRYIAFRARLP